MKFTKEDKIFDKENMQPNQYYKLSAWDISLLGWSCDLYENNKIIKKDIELNLDLPKYVSIN